MLERAQLVALTMFKCQHSIRQVRTWRGQDCDKSVGVFLQAEEEKGRSLTPSLLFLKLISGFLFVLVQV